MGYALGIDLGTTFTAAAVSRNGRVEIVGLGNHASTIPTAVLLRDDGTLLVGDAAVRRGRQEPARLAKEFKRRFGDDTPIILEHTAYSAERLMAVVAQHVVDTVSDRQGGTPDAVVLAHPANWGPFKRELLGQAAAVAGLRDAGFVAEPEAAAVHFAAGERVDEGGVVAVYDLGGGTFDAAVMRRVGDSFVTLGQPQGIERLGGIDFDESVLSHVRATIGDAFASMDPDDPTVRAALMRLRADCVAAKEALSADAEAVISVLLPGVQTQVRLTRPEFESMIRPVLGETVEMLKRAIQFAGVTAADLSAVVLAGGSSRIPLVAEMVSQALSRPVSVDAHPKDTVAMGAARLAADRLEQPAVPASAMSSPAPTRPQPREPMAPSPEPSPRSPAASSPPLRRAPAADPPRRKARRRRPSRGEIIAAALILASAGGIGVYALTRDGDGPSGRCADRVDPCVEITNMYPKEGDSSTIMVDYSATFEPNKNGELHVHFYFFDTVAHELAGGDRTGYTAWGIEDAQGLGTTYWFLVDDVPSGASEMCVAVAQRDHELYEPLEHHCFQLIEEALRSV